MTILLATATLAMLWVCFLVAQVLHKHGLAGCFFLVAARSWAAGAAIKAAQERYSEIWVECRRQAIEESR